jgi:multidrug efflux pump subunit AcrA (membrane-fusion protein)
VRIPRGEEGKGALVVPEKALVFMQGKYSVGVVDDSGKVSMRNVELGARALGVREVTKGVSEGERVVVEGVQKISDGAQVKPEPVPPEPAPSEKGEG